MLSSANQANFLIFPRFIFKWLSLLFFLVATLLSVYIEFADAFTCQGVSYNQGLTRCPDGGVQKHSIGGNVSFFVRSATNLPNRDFTGPSSLVSDPYVKFTAGSFTTRTKAIRNNLNPVWNEYVNLGLLGSATEIKVEIWDSDIGLEFSDDLLVRSTMRVPFCSTFYANESEVDCGKPFGCSSDDSLWAMPKRQLCNETGVISFVQNRACTDDNAICLFLDVLIVPFTMNIELEYKNALLKTPELTSAAAVSGKAPWTFQFGQLYFGDSVTTINVNAVQTQQLKGALMYRVNPKEKAKGISGDIKFYASVNFPANIYICRDKRDNADGIPEWISADYSTRNRTINQLILAGSGFVFECFYQQVSGTVKNKYGGVMSGAIPFRTNTLPGKDNDFLFDLSIYRYMYVILAIPRVIIPLEEIIEIIYDASAFIESIAKYGFVWMWFVYFGSRLLKKINYRLDRLKTYIVSRVMTGEDKNLIAALFLTYAQSPSNIEFRAHLYHAENVFHFCFAAPFFLLLSWGIILTITVRPVSLGFAIMFMITSAIFFWYGFRLWESCNWRLTPHSLVALAGSALFFLMFIISVIFVDPAVVEYGKYLNFSALGLVFGTLNCVPLLLLVFKQDKTYKTNLQIVINKFAEAVSSLKQGGSTKLKQKDLKANKLIHALLGECYTINPNVPFFKFSTVLQELPKESLITIGKLGDEGVALQKGDDLYNFSVALLLLYIFIAVARTEYPSLSFLNCLTLMLFDAIHTGVANGDIDWSPGYKIGLLVLGRMLIMGSGPSLWLMNYSLGYLLYSVVLIREIINDHLPRLSNRQASEIVFSMNIHNKEKSSDIAGSSYFCLGWLTFAFLAIICVSSFGGNSDVLPTPPVNVFGTMWPVYSFGIIAFLLLVTGSLMSATVRAVYLKKYNLLKDWVKKIYMFKPSVDVVMILGIYSEIAIVTSGIVIYGITKANFVLIVAVFIPIIAASLGHSYRVWVSNDYELIHWPPRDVIDTKSNETPSDLEVAFNMIENLFGDESDTSKGITVSVPETDSPQEKTMKGLKMPMIESAPKTDIPIKMPPLPLKSVLRKKRYGNAATSNNKPGASSGAGTQDGNGSSKPSKPTLKDIKAAQVAVVSKAIGDEVLDPNDIWNQYEQDNEDEQLPMEKKSLMAEEIPFRLDDRKGFLQHPRILKLKKRITESKFCQLIIRYVTICVTFLKKKSRKYTKITVFKLNDDDDADNGENKDPESGGDVGDNDEDDDDNDDEDNGNGEKQKKKDPKKDIPAHENLQEMSFTVAVIGGYLTKAEYTALFSWIFGMFMIMMMGVAIAKNNSPTYVGHVFWVSIWMFILTFIPIIKYYNTFVIDKTMIGTAKFVAFFHFMFCVCFFGAALNSDIGIPASLWVLDYFFYFPAFLYLAFEFYRWCDDGFKLELLDKDGDGQVTIAEYLAFFKAYPILLAMMIILNWQFYLWISYILGQVATIMLLVGAIGYIFVRDWAANDFFLSPELTYIAQKMIDLTLFLSLCIALFSNANPIFSLSVFFITFILRETTKVVTRIMVADADTLVFFSPTIMPVYSYDPQTNDLVDETRIAVTVLKILLAAGLWGAALAMFLYPVNVGIALACLVLLVIAAIVSTGMTYLPMQLGRYSSILTAEAIIEAANAAQGKFGDRRLPLSFEIAGWDREAFADPVAAKKTPLDLLKERTSIDMATEVINDIKALTHVRDDSDVVLSNTIKLSDEEEVELPWYKEYYLRIRSELKKLFELMPLGKSKGWKRHGESLFDLTDCAAEAIIVGRGPYGFLGAEGKWYELFLEAQKHPRMKFLQQPWLNAYDSNANNTSRIALSEALDSKALLERLPELDQALDFVFKEEFRCASHFLLMLIVSADAKLQRERVLFQKFLRENRFRLASNGITPPPEIFTSASYASINIPLTAVWLASLTSEEKERFQLLKGTFSDEQKDRDELVDSADYIFTSEAIACKADRIGKEKEYAEKVKRMLAKKVGEKVQAFMDSLDSVDKARFQLRKDIWVTNADCFVDPREQALYDRFKLACFPQGVDEYVEMARSELAEIEAAQRDCRMGEYGRAYQFVDSEFPPSDISVGECQNSSSVLGWRCAPGVNEGVQLFSGGTDPDDISQGVIQDQWLLSALSMLAAAGGVGDGLVDEQIANLFIGHYAMDGEITHHTEVGAYCVKLYKQGFWNPIIIDDLLPMRRKDYWTNENRGMACAHARECNGLWVSVVEKAYAKFYGSYAELERGYVHHALEDMTGCEAECIMLSAASRGVGKRALWDTLIRFQKNGYILGAGTGASNLVDKEIQDMGIVFNAAYTIYDIRSVDGNKLIKLRNPPGDHDEWKGDWSDKSNLWTRRLKAKLGFVDADDNTFFMSFDDFCNVFRHLYVCKWYDPHRWGQVTYEGFWKKSDQAEMEDANVKKQVAEKAKPKGKDDDEEVEVEEEEEVEETEEEKKQKAKARLDTSGGLPSRHNPGCVLMNNPQYSLRIHRPTEIKINVNQVDSRGKVSEKLIPFAIYIARNENNNEPLRLKTLDKENVLYSSGEPRADQSIYLYANLKPGLYVVMIAPYMAGMVGHFNISLVYNYRNEFLPLWPPRWLTKDQPTSSVEDAASKLKREAGDLTQGLRKGLRNMFGITIGEIHDDSDDENNKDKAAAGGVPVPPPEGVVVQEV